MAMLVLWLATLALAQPDLSSQPGMGEPDPLVWPRPTGEESMDEVAAAIRDMETAGRPRREIADWVSGALDKRIGNINSPERMLRPVNWLPWPLRGRVTRSEEQVFEEWNARQEYGYEETARWTWETRLGQCSEHASAAYAILERAGVDENYRILAAPGHEFVVWGIADGADPDDPSTWGPDAYVIDGWTGGVATPSDIQTGRWYKGSDGSQTLSDVTQSFDPSAPGWEVTGGSSTDLEDCFVATAAYGTPLAAEIHVLRTWRDTRLRTTPAGRLFIAWYAVIGPHAAAWIRPRPGARSAVRRALRPLVDRLEASP